MVFDGQGVQWPEMGKALIEADPRFRADILAMDSILQSFAQAPDWKIERKLSTVLCIDSMVLTCCR